MRRLTVSPGTMSVSAPRSVAVKQTLAPSDKTMTQSMSTSSRMNSAIRRSESFCTIFVLFTDNTKQGLGVCTDNSKGIDGSNQRGSSVSLACVDRWEEKLSLLDSEECVCSFKRFSRWKGTFRDNSLAVPGSLSVAEPARCEICGHCCSIYCEHAT